MKRGQSGDVNPQKRDGSLEKPTFDTHECPLLEGKEHYARVRVMADARGGERGARAGIRSKGARGNCAALDSRGFLNSVNNSVIIR